MKLIDPSIELITKLDGDAILKHLEIAIRNCYRSEDKICEGSANTLVKTILDSHHYSVIEHFNVTFRVICSRACMAQWTRHRHMSYSIESQRYICYAKDKFGGEITFVKPVDFDSFTDVQQLAYSEVFEPTVRYGDMFYAPRIKTSKHKAELKLKQIFQQGYFTSINGITTPVRNIQNIEIVEGLK